MVKELWPGHDLLYGTKSRADNSKTKQAGVVFLFHNASSQCHACTCNFINIFHMVKELWPGHDLLYGTKSRADNSKTKQARVVFLFHDTSSQSCMHL